MTNLLTLADRVQALTSACRETGKEVLLACGWKKTCVGNFYGPLYQWSSPGGKSYPEDRLPCPTESLDAAMTLAVDGYFIMAIHEMPRGWVVNLGSRTNDRAPVIDVEHDDLKIALCSAWIFARAASENSHG